MSNEAGIRRAFLIEAANKVKIRIAEFNKQAGPDDKAFRKLILDYFKPEKRA